MALETLGIKEYTGSPFIEGVNSEDVVRQWNKVAEASIPGEPVVISLPRKKFPDGASIGYLQELWKSGQLETVNGRGVALIASADSAEALLDTIGTARWLKYFGATEIMAVFKRLYGLRQDGVFCDKKTGDVKLETVTAFDTMSLIADATDFGGRKLFTRNVIVESHSRIAIGFGSIRNLATAAVTCYRHMGERLGLKDQAQSNWVVLAPDEGAHKTASLFAQSLGLDEVGFDKSRDRVTGNVQLLNVESSLAQLSGKKVGLFYDDEMATGSTLRLVVDAAVDVLDEFIVLAAHGNFSEATEKNLNHPKIKRVVVTDGMIPRKMIDVLPNGVKVEVLPLDESLGKLAKKLWKGDLRQELPDGWQLDPWLQPAA